VTRRAAIIVLDGLGIGPAHDTHLYHDEGSDTLGNVARAVGGLSLPELEALGLGRCADLQGVIPVPEPRAAFGVCEPASPGKDSTTGHWEICGLLLRQPFPTYPEGFPQSIIDEFVRRTGRGVLGNQPSSGTAVLDAYGVEHCRTGNWIVYTSADSVFQVAAHESTVPLTELYAACQLAREILQGEHGVSRVIAVGVGKVDDLFAGRGISSVHTATNREAYALIRNALGSMGEGLLLANVIEFDQTWGHRNDVNGFRAGLEELDQTLPSLLHPVREQDLVIFTADHGNDPTTPSTDHSREAVPLLVAGRRVRPADLGRRPTFADIGQTVAEFFRVPPLAAGTSFLSEVWRD
jgi:phosphopentomutase